MKYANFAASSMENLYNLLHKWIELRNLLLTRIKYAQYAVSMKKFD